MLVACEWGSSLAASARHSLVGGWSRPWAFVIRLWGLSSSVGGVVAAVPGHCLLWALGRCWWAPGHLVVGGRAVVCGRRLSLWVLGVHGRQFSLWVLGVRGRWVVIRRSWAVVCGRYTSSVGGGWLFVDGLFMGRLFVDWVVVCGRGGAVSCVVCHG